MELLCINNLGWISTIIHSVYWLGVLYEYHLQDSNKRSILDIRLSHYSLMGYACLLYTIIAIIIWQCFKFLRKNRKPKDGFLRRFDTSKS